MTPPGTSRLGWRGEARTHLALAMPLCIGYVGQQLMGIVDTAMLGHYDETALAGGGVGHSLLLVITVAGMGLLMGLDTLAPQAVGAGKPAHARGLFRAGVRLAIVLSVPLTALTALSPFVLAVFGVDEAVASDATIYVYGRLPSILPFLLFTAQRSYLQALGITRPLVVAMVVANVVNVFADFFLIYGDRSLEALGLPGVGLPELGILGAAFATSAVSIVSVVIAGFAVRGVACKPHVQRGQWRRIVWVGLPVSGHLIAEVGVFALSGILAGRLGEVPAGAHNVALILASLSFSSAMGMSAATSVRVGHAVGAGDRLGARRAGLLGIGLGAAMMGAAGLVFLAIPELLAGLFTSDVEVLAIAVPLLRIAAFFQLFDAVQAIAAGALRGAGDTRAPFIANLAGHYGAGLWLALYLTFVADLGAAGLWWGLSAGLALVAVFLGARFLWLTARPIARA